MTNGAQKERCNPGALSRAKDWFSKFYTAKRAAAGKPKNCVTVIDTPQVRTGPKIILFTDLTMQCVIKSCWVWLMVIFKENFKNCELFLEFEKKTCFILLLLQK